MAQRTIFLGTEPDDATGDPWRSAFDGANKDFADRFTGLGLEVDTTVNLTTSMTTAQIQAAIDAQPRNLRGKTLTFQFADGTYTLSATLLVRGFFGGTLRVYGNAADSTNSQTKSVTLTGAANVQVLSFDFCQADIQVRYIRFTVNAGSSYATALQMRCQVNSLIEWCAFTNTASSTAAGSGFGVAQTFAYGRVRNCNFAYLEFALMAYRCGYLVSINNASTFNSSVVFRADAGFIFREGTQPTGAFVTSTANGGQIP